nr:MAG TPA: centrome localization domain protein [Caudoviricetes sp.]
MELDTIKTRITSLEANVRTKQEEINRLNEEKAQFEQKAQSLNDEIQRLEQDNSNKREEIKKYKTVVEIMEL